MDDAELLRRELRATREELVRRGSADPDGLPEESSPLPLMPDREECFLRLALMSVDELESHADRLERDLRDLREGFDTPDDGEGSATD